MLEQSVRRNATMSLPQALDFAAKLLEVDAGDRGTLQEAESRMSSARFLRESAKYAVILKAHLDSL